jgi:RNA 3'-terminal phosphate cyclase
MVTGTTPTPHTMTNVDVIKRFVDVPIEIAHEHGDSYRVTIGSGVES